MIKYQRLVLLMVCLACSCIGIAQDISDFSTYLDRPGGRAATGVVSSARTIFAKASVLHVKRETPATIQWNLYSGSDRIADYSTSRQDYRPGQTGSYGYELVPKRLMGGDYTIEFRYIPMDRPAEFTRRVSRFHLPQPVTIESLYASSDDTAKEHSFIMQHGQAVHLFGRYSLPENNTESVAVRVVLSAKDAGDVFDSGYFERVANKPYFHLGIEKDAVPPDTPLTYQVWVKPIGGAAATHKVFFTMQRSRLAWDVPGQLQPGGEYEFTITVPEGFTPPYSLRHDEPNSVFMRIEKGTLRGKLRVISASEVTAAAIEINLTDSTGRKAILKETLAIKPQAVIEAAKIAPSSDALAAKRLIDDAKSPGAAMPQAVGPTEVDTDGFLDALLNRLEKSGDIIDQAQELEKSFNP